MNSSETSLVAISGSLREKSTNSTLLRSIVSMVPSHVPVRIYNDMGQLPHFNPDLDSDDAPVHVAHWRSYLEEASGVLICTPEYAKGVPGSLKNALDWIVSSGELVNKPVAVVSVSPHPSGGEDAHNSLVGTLSMMSAVIVKGATLKVPFITLKLGTDGQIIDEETQGQLQHLVDMLIQAMTEG
ncbi:NADPH-dependent FMN reductase [Alicyclobacillus sp. ALC3]|uniref:NADPH-dependent FMN reductase n=1 Tax=Alicyclobacillus sp. ALC3 TaxID=2796143 RepID=UPI00237856A5|nr:NADPH-dependent FMN reductase [Alicyclobacillus sp. ALC3]WDL97169.1 NAD(P)H-dependent oxidoreductase [Alicyclobacillus sp. ALC3]